MSYGPIRQPHELLDDPHLQQGGALVPTTVPGGAQLSTAALPIEFDGMKTGKRCDPPAIGADTISILKGLGMDDDHYRHLARSTHRARVNNIFQSGDTQ